ncbi:MAG: AAA family ATPase, partial [Bacteroidales bacterium]|nr:AAA family ATPase [Bacteroidales bacterium]
MLLSLLAGKINVKRTLNIIEEPEQNLFPSSQRKMLNALLEFNNSVEENQLIITTHSPYIINYLMLAIK